MTAQHLIEKLKLQKHPEGGYYSETYRSKGSVMIGGNPRNLMTCIYYLLEGKQKSLLHRLKSDELWFFHQGNALEIVMIDDGKAISKILGNNHEKGECPQLLIPANTWFGARLADEVGFALVSCVVSPGFEFEDFELADRKTLISQHPALQNMIAQFSR